jgi:hypothetical protein
LFDDVAKEDTRRSTIDRDRCGQGGKIVAYVDDRIPRMRSGRYGGVGAVPGSPMATSLPRSVPTNTRPFATAGVVGTPGTPIAQRCVPVATLTA